MPDIKGTLFWLAVVLMLLIWMMRGCGSSLDKFREHRERQRQHREERWDEWREQRNNRDGIINRWRKRTSPQPEASE